MSNGYGQEQARLELNAVGTLDVEVPKRLPETVYGRVGDKTFFAMLAALIVLCALQPFNR